MTFASRATASSDRSRAWSRVLLINPVSAKLLRIGQTVHLIRYGCDVAGPCEQLALAPGHSSSGQFVRHDEQGICEEHIDPKAAT